MDHLTATGAVSSTQTALSMDAHVGVTALRLGQLVFDGKRGRLLDSSGKVCHLRPKAFALLSYLVAHQNQLLGRAHLTEVIWPGVHVTRDSLTHLIREIRNAIGDVDGSVLQTVPGRGYIFTPALQLTDEPPPARPVVTTGAFPAPVTSFVGRRRELSELATQIRTHRLVTITGMGGVGKTRLLQRFASEPQAPGSPGEPGLFCVDLCPMSKAGNLWTTISEAAGLIRSEGSSHDDVLPALRHKSGLFLIDNAEHLVTELGGLLAILLNDCPQLSFIVTSRVALFIAGESILRLDPLPVPPPNACRNSESALRFDAVRLFVDRVTLVNPEFSLDDAKPEIVGEICRKLDGIALAIEMAVPRMQVLTAEQFLERLDNRFKLLTTRGSNGPLRQRSLRTMLEWSWELLWQPDQDLLILISMFTGSVSLSALVAMRDPQKYPEWSVIDGLTDLVRASLVTREVGTSQPRFRLLETTRAFAQEQLAPGLAAILRQRHAQVFTTLFETAETEWPVMHGQRWVEHYGPEIDNLRSALAFAFGPQGDTELGLRLVAASRLLWWELPSLPLREACQWSELASAHIGLGTPPAVAARVLLAQSWRDISIGDLGNIEPARRSVSLLRPLNEPVTLGAALWQLGCSLVLPNTLAEAKAVMDEALEVLRPLGATKWHALALSRRGSVHRMEDEVESALLKYNQAFAMSEAVGCHLSLAQCGICLAELMYISGAHQASITLLTRLRGEIAGGIGISLLSTLATQLAADDQMTKALTTVGEVLETAGDCGLTASTARAIETLAMLLAEHGQERDAARLLGWVFTIHSPARQRSGGRLDVFTRLGHAIRTSLGEAVVDMLLGEGGQWPEAVAVEVATGCHRALVAAEAAVEGLRRIA